MCFLCYLLLVYWVECLVNFVSIFHIFWKTHLRLYTAVIVQGFGAHQHLQHEPSTLGSRPMAGGCLVGHAESQAPCTLPSINASMCTGVQTVLLSLLTLKWLWLPFFLPLESKIIRKNFLSFPSEKILSFASQVLSTQERGQNHFNFYQFPMGVWKEWVFPFGKDRQVDDQQMVNTR